MKHVSPAVSMSLALLGLAEAAEPRGKPLLIELPAEALPTRRNDSHSDYCDPFGFHQDSLPQFETMAGLVLRF